MCIECNLVNSNLFIGTQLQTTATFIVSMDKSNPLLTAAVDKISVKGRIFRPCSAHTCVAYTSRFHIYRPSLFQYHYNLYQIVSDTYQMVLD